jgi:ribosome-associated heat shock protein Hsp15
VNESVRLDIWLDVACLFKTRSEAKRACEGGKVEVNGEHAKPHRMLREGDRIRISRGYGRHQDVVVRIAIDQHVKKSEARALYDDHTPSRHPRRSKPDGSTAPTERPLAPLARPTAGGGVKSAASRKADNRDTMSRAAKSGGHPPMAGAARPRVIAPRRVD